MEEFFKQLEQHGETARGVGLRADEKNAMRENIRAFMEAHPVSPKAAAVRENRKERLLLQETRLHGASIIFRKYIFNIRMIAAILIAAVLGGSVSFAAESSLPGDVLYPVKVSVNEEVRSLAAISSEAEAKLQAELATRRLKEAEQLAAEGRLNAETRTAIAAKFEEHAKEAQMETEKTETEAGVLAAANIQSDFEAALEAHEKVLAKLETKNTEAKEHIEAVLGDVRARLTTVADARMNKEAKVFASTSADIKVSAEDAKKLAEKKLAEMRKIREAKMKKSARTAAEANGSVDVRAALAEKAFEDAQAKLEAGASADAFTLFMKANRSAQSAKLLTNAAQEFDIEINGEEVHLQGDADTELNLGGGTVKVKDGRVEVRSGGDSSGDSRVEVRSEGEGGNVEVRSSVSGSGASVNTTQTIQVNTGGNVRVGI